MVGRYTLHQLPSQRHALHPRLQQYTDVGEVPVHVQYPKTSAAVGAAYVASTIAYFMAYSKGPKNRIWPFAARSVCLLALCGMCVRLGAKALPEHVFKGGSSGGGGGDSGFAGRR